MYIHVHTEMRIHTFSMQEVIDYYNVNKSSVCSLQLDASKAFDMVNYCKLFAELLKRNICPLLLRLLLFMYTRVWLKITNFFLFGFAQIFFYH